MEYDFGKQLEKVRTERGLSLEQAAAAVRIRTTFLRALENSDLTKFPNAAYAKSFLLMYGRFLGVDLKSVAAQIDTTTQMKVEGYQYLTNRAAEQPKPKQEPEPTYTMAPTPRASGSWLPLLVLGGVIVMIGVAFVFWSNINRLSDSPSETPKSGAKQAADETAVQTLPKTPAITATPKPIATPAAASPQPPAPPPPAAEPEPPRPVVISVPKGAAIPAPPSAPAPLGEPEIPRARPISPVGRIAAADADALAALGAPKSQSPSLPPAIREAPADEENNTLAGDPNTIVLEPRKKTWVVIRSAPGAQTIFEDYLYPTDKPLRLPSGRYFIELKEADAVEISRNGRPIAYAAPGVFIQ